MLPAITPLCLHSMPKSNNKFSLNITPIRFLLDDNLSLTILSQSPELYLLNREAIVVFACPDVHAAH